MTTVFILVLLVLLFGIWVAQTIIVSSPCFPYLFPVTFVSYCCAYLSVYTLFYIAFCYISLPSKYLHSILLVLLFGQVCFAAYLCFLLQFLYQSAAIHTYALGTTCFSIFRSIIIVLFATNLFLCFNFIKLCSCNSLANVYGNCKIHQMMREV